MGGIEEEKVNEAKSSLFLIKPENEKMMTSSTKNAKISKIEKIMYQMKGLYNPKKYGLFLLS